MTQRKDPTTPELLGMIDAFLSTSIVRITERELKGAAKSLRLCADLCDLAATRANMKTAKPKRP